MSISAIYGVIDCDRCGKEFKVEIDAAYKPPSGWSCFDVAEDACRGGQTKDGGLSSVQDGRMLCPACTKIVDEETPDEIAAE